MTDQKTITTPNAMELLERIKKCRSMIGKMCSEGRPPRMEIPAKHDERNEDIYICDTLRMMEQFIDMAHAEYARETTNTRLEAIHGSGI